MNPGLLPAKGLPCLWAKLPTTSFVTVCSALIHCLACFLGSSFLEQKCQRCSPWDRLDSELSFCCLARAWCFVPFLRTQLLGSPVFQTGSPRSGRVIPPGFPFLFSGGFLFSYLWISEWLSCFVFLFFQQLPLNNTHTHIFVFVSDHPSWGYIPVCLSVPPSFTPSLTPSFLCSLGWKWICSQGWPDTK